MHTDFQHLSCWADSEDREEQSMAFRLTFDALNYCAIGYEMVSGLPEG